MLKSHPPRTVPPHDRAHGVAAQVLDRALCKKLAPPSTSGITFSILARRRGYQKVCRAHTLRSKVADFWRKVFAKRSMKTARKNGGNAARRAGKERERDDAVS